MTPSLLPLTMSPYPTCNLSLQLEVSGQVVLAQLQGVAVLTGNYFLPLVLPSFSTESFFNSEQLGDPWTARVLLHSKPALLHNVFYPPNKIAVEDGSTQTFFKWFLHQDLPQVQRCLKQTQLLQ